jgi:hypothetical protein
MVTNGDSLALVGAASHSMIAAANRTVAFRTGATLPARPASHP